MRREPALPKHPARPGRLVPAAACLLALLAARTAPAYIDRPPEKLTLPRLLLEFKSAGVFRVERVDLERGAVRYVHVELIQGRAEPRTANHVIAYGRGVPEPLRAIRPGQTAVLFRDDPYRRGITLVGGTWYTCVRSRESGWWRLAALAKNYDLNCCFRGSAGELAAACRALLAGRDVVVRCRKRRRAKALHLVRYDLRRPHDKPFVAPGTERAAPGGIEAMPADVRGLVVLLKHGRPPERIGAAAALGELAPAGAEAVGALAAVLADAEDPLLCRAAAVALGRMGPPAARAVPGLVRAVLETYGDARGLAGYEAAVAVSRIDPNGAHAPRAIRRFLTDDDSTRRRQAVVAAGMIGPTARGAADALAAALRDENQSVRYQAARALARIDPDVRTVLPALARALADKDKFVRGMAARTLQTIDPTVKHTLQLWLRMLAGSADATVRHHAAGALARSGQRSPTVRAALERAAKDPDRQVRSRAAHALRRMPPR